jgi:cation transport ATPase
MEIFEDLMECQKDAQEARSEERELQRDLQEEQQELVKEAQREIFKAERKKKKADEKIDRKANRAGLFVVIAIVGVVFWFLYNGPLQRNDTAYYILWTLFLCAVFYALVEGFLNDKAGATTARLLV